MNDLNSLLNLYHVNKKFIDRINKKRAMINKGISFNFSTHKYRFYDELNKQLNIRITNPTTVEVAFNYDWDNSWIYPYCGPKLGGRTFLFSTKDEEAELFIKIPEYNVEFSMPLENKYGWFYRNELDAQIEKFKNLDDAMGSDPFSVQAIVKTKNIPMIEESEITENCVKILLLRYFAQRIFMFINANEQHDILSIIENARNNRSYDTKFIKLLDQFLASKDVSLFLTP